VGGGEWENKKKESVGGEREREVHETGIENRLLNETGRHRNDFAFCDLH